MTDQTDRYSCTRNPEQMTIGDSVERFRRDPDAFTAGVQYALDRMTCHVDRMLMDPHTSEWLIGCASDILANVQNGQL